MIVYSVTVKIDLKAHSEWLEWMRNKHIPDVLATGKFVSHKLFKVLAEDETDGVTYNIQYFAKTMGDYFDYQNDHAQQLQAEHRERYQDKFVAFRTLLREIE